MTEHSQVSKEALFHLLADGHGAPTNSLEDAFNKCAEQVLTEMTLKVTL